MSRPRRQEVRHWLARASLPYQAQQDVRLEMEWTSWSESDDGYRPAGQGEELVSTSHLVLPPFRGENGRMHRRCSFRTFATTLEGLAENLRQELEGLLACACLSAEELAAEEAEDAASFEALLQEEHETLFLRDREDSEGSALAMALDSAMDRARRHAYGQDWTTDPRWSEPVRAFPVTRESVEGYLRALRTNLQVMEEVVGRALDLKGEVEIAAAADAATRKAAIEAAMSAPAGAAPWFTNGDEAVEELRGYGRAPGEGFGQKLAGEWQYLPGGAPPVGLTFMGHPSKHRSTIVCAGLDGLGGYLPESVGKSDVTLCALVIDPAWSIAVAHSYKGEVHSWELWTSEGRTQLDFLAGWDGQEERWTSTGWDGAPGVGPSKAALRLAHGLATPRGEKPAPTPAPSPVAVTPASMAGLMGKFGKKR